MNLKCLYRDDSTLLDLVKKIRHKRARFRTVIFGGLFLFFYWSAIRELFGGQIVVWPVWIYSPRAFFVPIELWTN